MDSYGNYFISTSTNASTEQKTSGWEFEARHDFGFLGRWGRNFSAFASFAMTDLGDAPTPVPYTIDGPSGPVTVTPAVATITRRADRFGGAGVQYAGKRLSVQVRGVYRNENEIQRTNLNNGNFLRRYEPEETRIDVTLNYVISKNFSFFLSGRDVFNAQRKQINKDDFGEFPAYAELQDIREFGVVWSTGITAKF